MVKKKEVPARADLVDYRYSVAGHAGTMCDADGELFIKPCTQQELDFYNAANANHPEFAALMPSFIGSLLLNEQQELSSADDGLPGPPADADIQDAVVKALQSIDTIPAPALNTAPDTPKDNVTWVPNKAKKIKTDLAVVLENASSGFSKPNILDAKLGKRLWADDAPQQKKTRFDKITSQTTHGTLGFRIAGMRVYRGSMDKSELDDEDFKCYDKDYGRVTVNQDNVVDAFRRFVYSPAAGVSKELGQAVAAAFVRDLRHVEDVLTSHETRMYSASLLFVFEGDGEKLREAIEANNAAADEWEGEEPAAVTGKAGGDIGRASSRVDSGIALMDGDAPGDSYDSDSDGGPSLPNIYQLKLIDFAHAEWTPGQGPDENALTGVRSLIRIFEELAA